MDRELDELVDVVARHSKRGVAVAVTAPCGSVNAWAVPHIGARVTTSTAVRGPSRHDADCDRHATAEVGRRCAGPASDLAKTMVARDRRQGPTYTAAVMTPGERITAKREMAALLAAQE